MAKKKTFKYDPEWAKAKKICRLSAADIRMAKELGFKPRTLMKNNPGSHQQWKQPVKFWIRMLYEKKMRKQQGKEQAEAPPLPDELPF